MNGFKNLISSLDKLYNTNLIFTGANADPQELTIFVQQLLQQMQSRFQTMSDTIISKIDCADSSAVGENIISFPCLSFILKVS